MAEVSRGERVIIETRYGGTYEGGLWAAFVFREIPEAAHGDDVECQRWWDNPTMATGVGSTPQDALEALEHTVRACQHPQDYLLPVPAGIDCRFCNQLLQPASGRVEDLRAIVDEWPTLIPLLNLYVPETLSIKGEPVDHSVAMAILGDAILAKGFSPHGFTEEGHGRTYHYRR